MVSKMITCKRSVQTAGSTIIKQHRNVSQADEIFTFWCRNLLWFSVYYHVLCSRWGCDQRDLCRSLETWQKEVSGCNCSSEVWQRLRTTVECPWMSYSSEADTALQLPPRTPRCASPSLLLRWMEASQALIAADFVIQHNSMHSASRVCPLLKHLHVL